MLNLSEDNSLANVHGIVVLNFELMSLGFMITCGLIATVAFVEQTDDELWLAQLTGLYENILEW